MTQQEIAATLRAARLAAGYTQRALSEALGYTAIIGPIQISQWESGLKSIPRDKLRRVAELLKVPLEELLP